MYVHSFSSFVAKNLLFVFSLFFVQSLNFVFSLYLANFVVLLAFKSANIV